MAQLRRPAKLIADTILIAGGFIEKLESSDFRFLISQSHLPFSLSATDAALPQSGAPTSCRPVADPIRPTPGAPFRFAPGRCANSLSCPDHNSSGIAVRPGRFRLQSRKGLYLLESPTLRFWCAAWPSSPPDQPVPE